MVSAGTLRTQDNLSIENAINCTGSMFAYCLLKKNDFRRKDIRLEVVCNIFKISCISSYVKLAVNFLCLEFQYIFDFEKMLSVFL